MSENSMAEQTPEDRLRLAAGLIKEGHYKGARAILRKTDHPKAREWLEKLELKINDVPDDPFAIVPVKKKGIPSQLIAFVILLVGVGIFGVLGYLNVRDSPGTVEARVVVYCFNERQILARSIVGCNSWAHDIMLYYSEETYACHYKNRFDEESFQRCLLLEARFYP